MQAIKLRTRITPNHRIEIQLPEDTPISDAEVILLIEPKEEIPAGESLQNFFVRLDQSDRPRLSAEEIDSWVEAERNAWE